MASFLRKIDSIMEQLKKKVNQPQVSLTPGENKLLQAIEEYKLTKNVKPREVTLSSKYKLGLFITLTGQQKKSFFTNVRSFDKFV